MSSVSASDIPRHSAWRTKDGFFSATPVAIAQTTDGYIWIGTDAGLCRWAGDRLITFTGGQGRVNAIVEDRDGRIWFSRSRYVDEGPLCRVMAAVIECYGKAHGIDDGDGLGPLMVDASGALWSGNDRWLLHGTPRHFRASIPRGLESNDHQAGVSPWSCRAAWCSAGAETPLETNDDPELLAGAIDDRGRALCGEQRRPPRSISRLKHVFEREPTMWNLAAVLLQE
jgi:ligand-binding sensor domain-containing protein